jgi:ABC-2 type transport system ATP-binding protein
MRILAGSLPATCGTARVAGYDCFDQPMEVKRVIGYLPEIPPLYTEMTVTEYLTFASRIKGISVSQTANAVDQVMQRLGLGEVRGRLIANLSRGFKQRVGLAQALVHNPPVLILDEPTAGLDPKQIIEIRELIRELAGSHTIILSTHILPEATAVARRVVIIHEGRIVAQDSQERLSARLRRSEKVSLMLKAAPPEARDQLVMLPGVLSVQQDDANTFLIEAELGRDLRDDLARFVVARQWGLLELKLITITLEDVFLRLTQEEPDSESVPRSPSQEGGSEPAKEVQA